MWFLLQISIMFAVMASNVYWEGTPNKYLAGLIAVGCAYGATMLLNSARRRSQKARQQALK
jgi:hypothetical protein